MSYQAIAFDLDGTLLSSQGTILESSKKAIKQAQEKGLKVYIVTGRHHTAVLPYYAELGLDTPVVCCNGTYLYDFQNDKVLSANPLGNALAEKLIHSAKAEGIHVAVYTRDAMTYEVLNAHFTKFLKWVVSCPENVRPNVYQAENFQTFIDNGTTIWKVLISDPNLEKMQKFVETLPLEVSAEWSWVDRVDITKAGNSKGACLAELLKREQIDTENVIAFGDNFNDISMLKLVGMGIAMGESELEVQQSAKKVIGSNNEDSIAQTLNELLQLN
ncbi:pyridoxal phosphatase [Glaesserella parasuis]|uniref:pyridoxal phosphatase n=1 Tax=Glaesserella parasuis TaxID=738 RepID=UPI000165B692|nr:pyridoxal phosphatase [Glaesserella parasuis]AWY45750.1 pyridoxal phosphatase [Glaesserella parasuis 29755]EQA96141.1 cof-like hydrolase family protein [Glaesserella parasuis 29755]MCT8547347.1 pyridoxal phosphatase [Glaesserella parasuis]MCT8551553.1 pyridoxal phosphatase [Glaesserella parasuis]MCT8592098.1 pyridoxal phosphatase [Glaesserella parasuis]